MRNKQFQTCLLFLQSLWFIVVVRVEEDLCNRSWREEICWDGSEGTVHSESPEYCQIQGLFSDNNGGQSDHGVLWRRWFGGQVGKTEAEINKITRRQDLAMGSWAVSSIAGEQFNHQQQLFNVLHISQMIATDFQLWVASCLRWRDLLKSSRQCLVWFVATKTTAETKQAT